MQHSLAILLSLSGLIHACCAESNVDHSLVRRDPLATDLFSFTSGPGSCTTVQQATISSWIADAIKLNNAAISAYGMGIGKQDAVHLFTIMGITMLPNGSPKSDTDRNNWVLMGNRLQAVQQFLLGNGVPGAKDGTKPLFFCNDGFSQYVPWTELAQDKNGQTVENPLTDDPFTVDELFPDLSKSTQGGYPLQPFWANIFKGYVFEGSPEHKMCFSTLYALTPRSRSTERKVPGIEVQLGRFERFICFCDQGWNKRPYTPDPMASLADIITYNNYPTAGSKGSILSNLIPLSATFYHELFHLVDDPSRTTSDYYMGNTAIFEAAAGVDSDDDESEVDPEVEQPIVNNPESYNFFAVASYLARNPPSTPAGEIKKPGVVFFGAIPVAAV